MNILDTPYNTFRSLYSILVRKADDTEDEMFQEQLNLMLDIMKSDLSREDLKKIFTEKIKQDRRNSDLYISSKDRSTINREIYLNNSRIRTYIIATTFTAFLIFIGVVGILFLIEVWSELSVNANSPVRSFSIVDTLLKLLLDSE